MAEFLDDSLRLKNWIDIPDFLTALTLGMTSYFQYFKAQEN